MSWFLVDDNLGENSKVLALLAQPDGFAALGFWTVCGTWSRRQKKNGFVSAEAADASARKCLRTADASALASALVNAGLWKPVPGGYQFHGWGEVYKTDDKLSKRKEKAAAHQREKRAQKKAAASALTSADGVLTRELTEMESLDPSPSPSPIRDLPVVPQEPAADNDHAPPPNETRTLVRKFHVNLLEELGSFPSQTVTTVRAYSALVDWAEGFPSETPMAALQAAFVGFREDGWAKSKGYPLGALASEAGKFYALGKALLDAEAA